MYVYCHNDDTPAAGRGFMALKCCEVMKSENNNTSKSVGMPVI